MSVIQIVKDNPIPVGIGVVILIVIISASRSGGGGGGTGNAANYLASQKLAAESNNSLAAINAQVEVAKGVQSVEKSKIAESAAATRAQIAAQMFQTSTVTGAQVSMNSSNNLIKQTQLGFANKENMQQLSNMLDIEKMSIGAKVDMNRDTLNAAQKAIETDVNFKLAAIAPTSWARASEIQNMSWAESNKITASGNAALNLLNSQQAFQEKSMPAVMAHQTEIARINSTGQLELAKAAMAAQMTKAEAEASASKNKSGMGWVSTIGSLISSFF